jgi:hypothetical protein
MLKLSIAMLAMLVLGLSPAARAADDASDKPKNDKPPMDCVMTYNLKGWSAIYKTAKGDGTITCTNGQKASVTISVHGGGITFGKTEIYDGKARISGGRTIDDIFGSYVSAAAHAGAGKAVQAEVLTKGEGSIALSGKGTGVDVGADFSGFTISKAEPKAPAQEAPKEKK